MGGLYVLYALRLPVEKWRRVSERTQKRLRNELSGKMDKICGLSGLGSLLISVTKRTQERRRNELDGSLERLCRLSELARQPAATGGFSKIKPM
jgi:hypothetical protein